MHAYSAVTSINSGISITYLPNSCHYYYYYIYILTLMHWSKHKSRDSKQRLEEPVYSLWKQICALILLLITTIWLMWVTIIVLITWYNTYILAFNNKIIKK